MNKDTIIASVIGLVLGLIAAVALWVTPRLMSKNNQSPVPVSSITSEIQTSPKNENLILEISSPKDGEITKSSKISVTGKTLPDSMVTINSPAISQFAVSDKEGNFTLNITITEGSNYLVITGIKNGQMIEKSIAVYYFSEE